MRLTRRVLLRSTPLVFLPLISGSLDADAAKRVLEITKPSLESTRRGFKWLMKTFNRDDGCGIDIGTPSDISCTAMVGLALLADGNTPIEGPLSKKVRDITTYLIDAVENNRFAVDLHSQVRADLSMYADHHFAALFLSQVYGEDWQIEPIERALAKLVEQIGRGQNQTGNWGQGRYPRLGAITGWCALRGAHLSGLHVEASAEATAKYLIDSMKTPQKRHSSLFTTSSGVRVLYSMGLAEREVGQKAFRDLHRMATHDFQTFRQFGGEQYLAVHYGNEAMLKRGGDMWHEWHAAVRDKLIEVQNKDGSWIGYSCITSRTFCTAAALLVLTSPNRYLPISQQ